MQWYDNISISYLVFKRYLGFTVLAGYCPILMKLEWYSIISGTVILARGQWLLNLIHVKILQYTNTYCM